MKSLRCICGRVLTAETGDALFAEVERHLDEMLTHARLTERTTDLERSRIADRGETDKKREEQ